MLSRLSFVESELSRQEEEVLKAAVALGGAGKHYLLDVIRHKPYQLQPETEKVLAALAPSFQAPYQIYNMAKLADMKFPSFMAEGKEYPLGYSLFEDDYEYDSRTPCAAALSRRFLRNFGNMKM